MARSIEFNKEEVIERAMVLFWEKGYEATSVRDLNKAMGISSSSMYETFGDKRTIFLMALARFCEVERASIAHMAARAPTPKAFIEQLFGTVETVMLPDSPTRGSLAFKTMVEFGTLDADVTQLLLAHYFGIADIIATVVREGQQHGTVSATTPALELAYTILSTLHGVATLKGVKPDFAFVSAITQNILRLLNS
jgi:TetR/AcrR family transcriptional repressor of nem operon